MDIEACHNSSQPQQSGWNEDISLPLIDDIFSSYTLSAALIDVSKGQVAGTSHLMGTLRAKTGIFGQ